MNQNVYILQFRKRDGSERVFVVVVAAIDLFSWEMAGRN